MELEWDPKKTAANIRKHNVAFQKPATVFGIFWNFLDTALSCIYRIDDSCDLRE